jgi:hypothetical protein
VTRAVPLADYLADLEAKANAAIGMGVEKLQANMGGGVRVTTAEPRATLALIAKIRHLVLIGESETRSLSADAKQRLFREIEVPE